MLSGGHLEWCPYPGYGEEGGPLLDFPIGDRKYARVLTYEIVD
jgi:hypothetical protein